MLQQAGWDDAWRARPITQQPQWPDPERVTEVSSQLAEMPPLVPISEIDALRERLASVASGNSFLLQGGDCAETFAAATAENIRLRVDTVLQMAVVLNHRAEMPVVTMGRMAGQFAKPRSSDTETRGGVTLPAYRGDVVNGYDFTQATRTPDPARLLRGYEMAASTLDVIRNVTKSGFADLREVEFFTGHEGLLMDYEAPLTRRDEQSGKLYSTSAHFLWIGERTRNLDGAHVEYFASIRNPIGVKLGPSTTPADVLELIDKLDPSREPGRLTFITRMGAGAIATALPPLLEAVKASDATPLWVCDPMHGNGITTPTGYKTRRFDDVTAEVCGFFVAHRAAGTIPGGVHVELTGDDVTECLGGAEQIDEAALATRYESLCDPRLNHLQSLELAFLVAEELAAHA
jgi:3-deoxy-7-phosphoheptulonate synthase